MTTTQAAQIIVDPDVFGGKPYIEGRRITVQHIADHHEHFGWSVEKIAEQFLLSLAQVYAALAYYHDHKQEIEASIDADEQRMKHIPNVNDVRLIITPKEAADEFGISVNAVYQAIRRGRLRARKSGKTLLILRRDAAELWGGTKK